MAEARCEDRDDRETVLRLIAQIAVDCADCGSGVCGDQVGGAAAEAVVEERMVETGGGGLCEWIS